MLVVPSMGRYSSILMICKYKMLNVKIVNHVDVDVLFHDRNDISESEIDAENVHDDKVDDVIKNFDECVMVVDVLFVIDGLDVLIVDDDVPEFV